MTTIGYATLQIVPSLRGVSDSINKQLGSMPDVGKVAGTKIGRGLEAGVAQGAEGAAGQVKARLSERLGAEVGSVVGRGVGGAIRTSMTAAAKVGELALKGALIGAAGAATVAAGGVGLALTKGFDRLKSIDEATFKLKALGHSGAETKTIMDSALASVKGTAFGLGDAATAAASAVAAGIKPGQDLTKYLGEVGDAAAVAGTSFTDMGSIFNKIQTQNKAYTDDLQQLSDRGLPIFTWLQQEYGVTADKLSDMVQKGQVDSAHFQDAINKNIGGAAKTMGQSFAGSVDNAEAALGRLGAAFLKPLFVNSAGGIGDLTTGLDHLTDWVNAHQPEIIHFFSAAGQAAIGFSQDMLNAFGKGLHAAADFSAALGTALDFLHIDNSFSQVSDTLNHTADTLVNTAGSWDTAKAKVKAWGDAAVEAAHNAQNAVGGAVTGIGTAVGALPFKKVIDVGAKDNATPTIVGIGNAVAALKDKTINITAKATVSGQASTSNGTAPTFFGGDYSSFGIQPFDEKAANPTLFGPSTAPPNPIRTVPQLRPQGGGRAGGGQIVGPGGPTDDVIPIWVSNGEFVVNAADAQKNLPLLESINSGKSPGTDAADSAASSAGGISVPSSISGLSSFGLDSLGAGVGTTGSGSDLSLFGKAAGSAVSGQVSSLSGVFGAGDNPPFLNAASQLLGGIKIGGHGGSSTAPIAATPTAMGTPPPDDAGNVHGTRAGQAPGPVFNTTISAFDTTDAVRLWENKKNQMMAAKLSVY